MKGLAYPSATLLLLQKMCHRASSGSHRVTASPRHRVTASPRHRVTASLRNKRNSIRRPPVSCYRSTVHGKYF